MESNGLRHTMDNKRTLRKETVEEEEQTHAPIHPINFRDLREDAGLLCLAAGLVGRVAGLAVSAELLGQSS